MSDTDPYDDQEPPSGGRNRELTITINDSPDGLESPIRKAARATLTTHHIRHGTLDIAIIGDAEMRRQHAHWLNQDSTTDVLTFDLRDDDVEDRVEAQLLVCKSVARRRARSRKTDWHAELLLYVVHGCLHLCGFDDHTPEESARIHEQEDRILQKLGWGPVFSSKGDPGLTDDSDSKATHGAGS